MNKRIEIGDGYSISRVINGGWQLSEGHILQGRIDFDAVHRAMLELVQAGLTTFDCADIYTGVEERIGEFIAAYVRQGGSPDEVQVHTKYVPDRASLASLTERDTRSGIERSLKRLRVDRLDLVQFHWWDYRVPGYLETLALLDKMRGEGKIRCIGLTNFDTKRTAEIVASGIPVRTIQVQYSLLDRRPANYLAPYCAKQGVKILAYGSLAGGFLSAKWLDKPRPTELDSLDNRSLVKYYLMIEEFGGWDAFQELLRLLCKIGEKHGVSPSLVAQRWVLERDGVAAIIVGLRSEGHIRENQRVFSLELDEADRELLADFLAAHPGAAGDTYDLERVEGGVHAAIIKTDLNKK